jgi:hypothetical protein
VFSIERPIDALAIAVVWLCCSCAPAAYEPPRGFVPKPSLRPEIGLMVLVEGATTTAELAEVYAGFETGVVSSFEFRGYRPVLLERIVRAVAEAQVRGEEMDARDQVLWERSAFAPKARAQGLDAFAIVRLLVHRVRTPSDAPSITLASSALQGYANYYGWAGEAPLFFSEMQSDANWMPIIGTVNTTRSQGAWFSYPTRVWARSMARRLLRELPTRQTLRAERVTVEPLRVPSAEGHAVVPGLRRDFTSELSGEETEFRNYQDAAGNGFSVLVTNGVTWGWEVIPRQSDAYLLVDPACSFKPTEVWPTTAEAPVPIPGCVRRGAPAR